MFSGKFLKDLLERAVATFAQGYVAAVAVLPGDILDFDALKVAAGAAVLSVFKAFAALKVGNEESASLATDI